MPPTLKEIVGKLHFLASKTVWLKLSNLEHETNKSTELYNLFNFISLKYPTYEIFKLSLLLNKLFLFPQMIILYSSFSFESCKRIFLNKSFPLTKLSLSGYEKNKIFLLLVLKLLFFLLTLILLKLLLTL